jgi:regulator of protease activity HflC (stomatin/prohibitin superfamily)
MAKKGKKKKMNRTIRYVVITVIIVVVAALLIDIVEPSYGFFGKVPTGHVGILTHFGKVQDANVGEGLCFKNWFDKITNMSLQTQKLEMTISAFSKDLQEVTVKLAVNYNIDRETASTLFQTVGVKYEDILIRPSAEEDTKIVFAEYGAEGLIINREELPKSVKALLTESMSPHGIKVSKVAIEDIDFKDAFTDAVERKQVATQDKLTEQIEQDRKTIETQEQAKRDLIVANTEAEKAKIAAEADLEVTKIQADAAEYAGQKEAAKNKAISEWLTTELIDYYRILQWDGKMPIVYGGNTMPLLDMGGLLEEGEGE